MQITWYKSWKILWKKTVVDAWTFTGNTSGRSGIYGPWAGYYGIVVFWLVGFNWLGYLNTFWLLNPHFTVSLLALPICFTFDKWRSRKNSSQGREDTGGAEGHPFSRCQRHILSPPKVSSCFCVTPNVGMDKKRMEHNWKFGAYMEEKQTETFVGSFFSRLGKT